jgi:cytoskeleton protein RodZ
MSTARLGDYLREAREKAGLSLEQLAERTRVRLENLVALETENLDELPADAYVRGFVKIVCRELRLPAEEGLALYSKLRANVEIPDEIVWSEESTAKEPGALDKALQDPDRVISVAMKARKWAIPLGAIVVIVIVALVVRGAGVGAEEDDGEDVPAASESAPAVPPAAAGSPSRPTGGAVAKPEDLAKAQELLANLEKPADRKVVPVEPPEPQTPAIRVTTPPPAATSPTPAPPTDPEPPAETGSIVVQGGSTSPSESVEIPSETPAADDAPQVAAPTPAHSVLEPMVLEIEALREAEVTLILDGGGFPRKRSLITGERKSWKADSLFVISASDAGAIRLVLNGTDLGSPGAAGTPLTSYALRR